MKILFIIISWIEFLYTFPIWILLLPREQNKMRIESYQNKGFLNIFLSTLSWIFIYQVFIK